MIIVDDIEQTRFQYGQCVAGCGMLQVVRYSDR